MVADNKTRGYLEFDKSNVHHNYLSYNTKENILSYDDNVLYSL